MATLPVDLNGLPLTCKDPEAVRLYNVVLEMFCSQNDSFMKELRKALKLDPEFLLARCIMTCFKAESYNSKSPEIVSDIEYFKSVYESVTAREKMHIDAVFAFTEKNSPKACDLWDRITVQYPCDLQATRWVFGVTLEIGDFERMRNIMTRTIYHYPKDSPSYPYILSMYAFSLEETNSRDAAEEACVQSIKAQPKNPWGIHTMCHVVEEERPAEKGVEFLNSCRSNWEPSMLSHHIAWHLMLNYLDLNQIDELFKEYDKSLLPYVSADNTFGLLDASSLLWRLNVMGIDVGDRWEKVTESFKPRLGNPQLTWLECHLMMSLCHGRLNECTVRLALAHKLLKSMEDYAQQQVSSDCQIANMLGVPLCNGLVAYGEGRYDDAFCSILPLKYDIIKIGGSWAQRQVFFITLIQAAIQAKDYNNALAQVLELKAKKPHSKLLQRLMKQVEELASENAPSAKKPKN